MWGFADAQEFSHVSPAMFERFAISNQKLGLQHFGMACYGCCEPLDNKHDIIARHLPRLRRLSVSPWSIIELAAEKIGRHAIYSWKPNPVFINAHFDSDAVRAMLKRVKQAAGGCHLEIILKDLRTCGQTNHYLKLFLQLVGEVFDMPRAERGSV